MAPNISDEERLDMVKEGLRIESRLAQIGSVEEPITGAVNFPIYQATAFRHPQ